jgi:V8-like Glu-specific endopeptidase
MKSLALLSLVMSFVLSACALPQVQMDNTWRFSQLRAATHKLDIGEGLGSCSGTMVAPRHYLTAAHCIIEGQSLKVEGNVATLLKKSEDNDLALLDVAVDCPCVPVASERPAVDTPVVVVGYPLGMAQFLTEGRIQPTLLLPPEYSFLMAISAQVAPGNSGGGTFALVNGEYVLVGVVHAVGVASLGGFIPNLVPHLALVVAPEYVSQFLKAK